MAKRPDAVIFDLGNTLVSVNFDRVMLNLTGRPGKGVRHEDLDTQGIMTQWWTGRLTPAEFHREINARTGQNLTYEEFVASWCDIFGTIPGMEELLREVAAVTKVGILSDTDPLHWAFELIQHPWLKLVPKPTLSHEIHHTKPNPEAYLAAAANIGLPPEKCLFVDDIERNVIGARAVGMQAVQFTGVEALRAYLVEAGILAR
jgi:HAD superfamily hydrolase (TIGR01509 family)